MERTVLHCDCNSFFASVESALVPELKKVPMAVAGDPRLRRGIILAKNEKAKAFGVKTAEPIWQAQRKCPNLVVVSPHYEEYKKYSYAANQIYQQYTDLVEPFGIDESWLDVTHSRVLFGDGVTIADELRKRVREELGITISVGVSFNKIFAKLGSDYKKPDATTVITRENFREFVEKIPASDLLYVGKSSGNKLKKLSIQTIGDLARCEKQILEDHFGKLGRVLYEYANGNDDEPVASIYEKREIKSIGNGMTFRRNLEGREDIRTGVTALADTVASRMRSQKKKCKTIQVVIKDPGLKSISRQKPLEKPTYLAKELAEAALALIEEAWDINKPIRMLSITGTNLLPADHAPEQLTLFDEERKQEQRKKQENLELTLDKIRKKYGKDAISIAASIHNDLGIRRHGLHDTEEPLK